MGLIDQFRVQASCRDLQKRTVATYEFWLRKFYKPPLPLRGAQRALLNG